MVSDEADITERYDLPKGGTTTTRVQVFRRSDTEELAGVHLQAASSLTIRTRHLLYLHQERDS
jgi:hypothetical protein